MQRLRTLAGLVAGITLVGLVGTAHAAGLTSVPVASNLDSPLFATAPADDLRLFIVERPGRIRILADGALLPTPFLDISGRVGQSGEGGLLGLAFAPDYATSGAFYVFYTAPSTDTVVSRFFVSAAPDVADPAETEILRVSQPYSNHNGGTVAFGPDGFLFIGMGDGGSGNDPGERAQDPADLLGKMLRIDVAIPPAPGSTPVAGAAYAIPVDNPWAGPDGVRDEIWAFGLRNPYRFSFDRETGDQWIADVGQGQREEIDLEPFDDRGGYNWGWDVMEGSLCNPNDPAPAPPCNHASLALPFYEYPHSNGNCSITGGFAYRGPFIPEIDGLYFFGDWCTGRIWSLDPDSGAVVDRTAELGEAGGVGFQLVGFGQDGRGELYVVLSGGSVYRITRVTECDDGIDNDLDGASDLADPGCGNDPTTLSESPQCNDGIDNDGDGAIDLADPTCGGDPSRRRESRCGGGMALSLLAPLLLRRRRR